MRGFCPATGKASSKMIADRKHMRWYGRIKHFDVETGEIQTKNKIFHFSMGDILNYDANRMRNKLKVDFTPVFSNSNKHEAIDVVIYYRPELEIPFSRGTWIQHDYLEESSRDVVDTETGLPALQTPDSLIVALSVFCGQIKLVSLTQEGRYQFLDEARLRHRIIYPSFIEEASLEVAINEFEELINTPTVRESEIQRFFEIHKDFILNDDYKEAHSQLVLSKEDKESLVPDFILEPVNQLTFCDLLELKLPDREIFVMKKNRARYSAAVFEAAAQLREYSKYFDDQVNRDSFHRIYPHLQIYKPRMFLIIGRHSLNHEILKQDIRNDSPQLFLKTYDEILARMKWKRNRLKARNERF